MESFELLGCDRKDCPVPHPFRVTNLAGYIFPFFEVFCPHGAVSILPIHIVVNVPVIATLVHVAPSTQTPLGEKGSEAFTHGPVTLSLVAM